MKWLLIPFALFICLPAFGQGTLKIFVAIDDDRNDMDIIDLNTSAISNYGVSVDSTNINFYTTTMSTQVVRLQPELLFEEEIFLDEPTASQEIVLVEDIPVTPTQVLNVNQTARSNNSNAAESTSRNQGGQTRSADTYVKKRSSKSKRSGSLKKSKKFKRYKGKCPKF